MIGSASGQQTQPEPWQEADALVSYVDTIAELRRRHLAGEPVAQLDLFARKPQPYPGWRPDPMTALAYADEWRRMVGG